jgi:hypothetical protein
MTFNIDVEKLPRNVLENAVKLNDTLKKIYITLYFSDEPTTPKRNSQKAGIRKSIHSHAAVPT